MRKLKPTVKTALLSTLLLTSTAVGIYSLSENKNTKDIGNKLKLDVDKIDSDTVKVSIDNIKEIPKSLQFSIKLEGDVVLKEGQNSINDLLKTESTKRIKNNQTYTTTNNILTDYTYNKGDNTIDILITSDNSLPKTEEKIEVFTLDIKKSSNNSNGTYKVIPNDESNYKYVSNTNKEYENLGVVSDDKVITMNIAPTIELNKSYINVVEGEILSLTPENLGITMNDLDGSEGLELQVKDLSQSNKPVIAEFKKDIPGIYELECIAIDSVGEKSEAKILPINVSLDDIKTPPTITKDGEEIKDITISAGEIFKPLENVKAIDAKGREVEVKLNVDKELDLDPKIDTTYTLTYTATDIYGNESKKVVTLKVIANKAPIISGVKDHNIKVGDVFNPKEGVKVTDEDKDIELVINSNVNTNIAGTYKVSYTATDSKGKTTKAQSTVVVSERLSNINNVPTINASDKIVQINTAFDPLIGVSASDIEDGDITNKIKVINNTVNINKEGIYTLTYSVEDSEGAITTKTINVNVENNIVLAKDIKIENKINKAYVKDEIALSAKVDENATIKDVNWISSDESIASIKIEDNEAIVTMSKEGKVTITAKTMDNSNLSDHVLIEVLSKDELNPDLDTDTDTDTGTDPKPETGMNPDLDEDLNINDNMNTDNDESNKDSEDKAPETGDSSILGYIGLGVLAISGLKLNNKRNKK